MVMDLVIVGILLSFTEICYSIPVGYILDVTHNCGAPDAGGNLLGANVTIKSDLHAFGKLTCNDGTGLPLTVQMPPINNTNTQVTTTLFYTGSSNGVSGTDCFFFHPNNESNVHVAKLEVWWGFRNATLMEDYETFTLTCTVDGYSTQDVAAKNIDDNHMAITSGFVHNLGNEYRGSRQLNIMDILDNVIDGTKVTMGKKIFLELSISGGIEQGLTPYDCIAQNSDATKSYKILNAGCGDGIIFKKTAGFITTGTKTRSPFFKVFKLIEANGNTAAVKYKCSFTTCNNTCDGSSCSLPNRRRRSADNEDDTDKIIGMASSRNLQFRASSPLIAKSGNTIPDIDIDDEIRRIEFSLANKYMDLRKIELCLAINYTVIGLVFITAMVLLCIFARRKDDDQCTCTKRYKDPKEDSCKILSKALEENLKRYKSCNCGLRVEEGLNKLDSDKLSDCKDFSRLTSEIQSDKTRPQVCVEVPDLASEISYLSDIIRPCNCGPRCLCPAVGESGRSCACNKTSDQSKALI